MKDKSERNWKIIRTIELIESHSLLETWSIGKMTLFLINLRLDWEVFLFFGPPVNYSRRCDKDEGYPFVKHVGMAFVNSTRKNWPRALKSNYCSLRGSGLGAGSMHNRCTTWELWIHARLSFCLSLCVLKILIVRIWV